MSSMKSVIKSKEQNESLIYAMNKISQSAVYPYIDSLYLFGSCARGEEKEDSDVDLFLVLTDEFPYELKKDLLRLKSRVSRVELYAPTVDLKTVKGDDWKTETLSFFQNIRKEGVQLWEREHILTAPRMTAEDF